MIQEFGGKPTTPNGLTSLDYILEFPEDTPVALGSPTVSDVCDPDPAVSNDAPALFPLGDTNVTWTATDDDGNTASVPQMVTVIDTTPPDISCNAVSSITPTDAPISFTASTSDQCQGPLTAEITDYDCFKFTKKGKLVRKTNSCIVSIDGDQITILDSGGVADMIQWTVTATDDSGNSTTVSITIDVGIKPEVIHSNGFE